MFSRVNCEVGRKRLDNFRINPSLMAPKRSWTTGAPRVRAVKPPELPPELSRALGGVGDSGGEVGDTGHTTNSGSSGLGRNLSLKNILQLHNVKYYTPALNQQ